MTQRSASLTFAAALLAALAAGSMTRCGGGDASSTDAPTDAREVADPSDVPADDGPGRADAVEASDATPAEADATPDVVTPLFQNPRDGRLYAAAGAAVITPTTANHPQTILLGGTGMNRVATGVHDDLEARALVLAEDDVVVVLVSMDLIGWLGSDIQVVKDALAARGVDPAHVIVASTHTHSAPDTMGIWGPEVGVSGRSPEYAAFLQQTVIDLVTELAGRLQPVSLAAVETPIDLPSLAVPSLVNDFRIPRQVNNRLVALRLDGDDGATVASLVNWHVHPEAMIGSSELSADMSRWVRLHLEKALGGTAVYLSGTVGGLQTILDEPFPARTEEGGLVLDENGQPTEVTENDEVKAWSAGHVIGELAVAALVGATTLSGSLSVDTAVVKLPFENPMMILGMSGGIIPEQPLDTSDKAACGSFGCLAYQAARVRFGALDLVTVPGEIFPETSVGRDESSHDWGSDENGTWGPKIYPAMVGYRDALPEGHILLEAGLAGTEIGYLVPASDYVPSNHPGYYEEYFCVSNRAEAALREGIRELLARP